MEIVGARAKFKPDQKVKPNDFGLELLRTQHPKTVIADDVVGFVYGYGKRGGLKTEYIKVQLPWHVPHRNTARTYHMDYWELAT
jgi:hypothetical protein